MRKKLVEDIIYLIKQNICNKLNIHWFKNENYGYGHYCRWCDKGINR